MLWKPACALRGGQAGEQTRATGDAEVWLCCLLAVWPCASRLTSRGLNVLTCERVFVRARGIECSVRREVCAADDLRDASQGSTGCWAAPLASGKHFKSQQGEAPGAKRET